LNQLTLSLSGNWKNLKNDELWQKGEIKKYYTILTDILRQYLENRFRVFSLELTTAETLDTLVKTGFKKDGSYNNLKTVLTGADLVKFAKYNPVSTEMNLTFKIRGILCWRQKRMK